MGIVVREATGADVSECGRICYEAFKAIAEAHNFLPDFPDVDRATAAIRAVTGSAEFYGVVAESDGKVVGSNFLDERNAVSGVGPITVDPEAQNNRIGARLMRAVIERSQSKNFAGTRLVQAGYHCRSLSLYMRLGFDVREHLVCLQGSPLLVTVPGCKVRQATPGDEEACNALCTRVHGFARGGELRGAVLQGNARVVERNGRITGYATAIAFFGHAVGATNDDLMALIAAAEMFPGPGFLVPSRNGELFRWCLGHGLRVRQTLTLMTMGLYGEPQGAWLPSILY